MTQQHQSTSSEDVIRVLLVDDSRLVLRLVSHSLEQDPAIEVVGQAKDVFEARELIVQLNPDMLVLDIHMPKMNGDEFLKRLMAQYPTPTIIFSSSVHSNERLKRSLLQAGAVGVVPKPNLDGGQAYTNNLKLLRDALVQGWSRLKAQGHQRRQSLYSTPPSQTTPKRRSPGPSSGPSSQRNTPIIAIGSSTGGTDALVEVLPQLPATTPGVLIVQHMLDWATEAFVQRLSRLCQMKVKSARNGEPILPGQILIAPGDSHMAARRGSGDQRPFVRVYKDAPVSGHCPSVDVLMHSVAEQFKANAVGVMLTGMGEDGARGMVAMRKAGARTIAQDAATCVVYGMPRAAWEQGGAERQVPLGRVAAAITELVSVVTRKSA